MTNEISLRDYVDMRLSAIDARTNREIIVLDQRLDKMNEMREQMEAQYQQFHESLRLHVRREEYNARNAELANAIARVESIGSQHVTTSDYRMMTAEVRSLTEWRANLNGRLWAIGIALAVLQVMVSITLHMLRQT